METKLKCPNCNMEYNLKQLYWTFKYYSHVQQMAMKCECKKKLGFKIIEKDKYELIDVTELMKIPKCKN